ncbi:Tyrosine-protein kinase Wzc [Acidisarcina polymorpha]|uniref:Tyrosine-protein kinase Wzc n=1 Tax=Acidisarcina polymorpha TaxID=2211140 RepID=A0A2Z5FXR3_9BACT|nr:Wzz/FepE/Etk N-terminal domain-containing protein [Acidisarcina polymorpha]AXC11520.1 Tyrosine-protein kinase Wzc [Acidisarcina polymorpha]
MERAGTAERERENLEHANQAPESLPRESLAGGEDQIDLFDLLLVLSAARRKIAIFTLTAMALGAALALLMKPTFSASALILPPNQGQSSASMLMNQLGIGGLAGGAVKSPSDLYLGILGSRTIADDIIAKFHLDREYKTKKLSDTRARLMKATAMVVSKDSLIHITVEDHDPRRASDLANAYIDELYAMNSHLAITEAAQRRVFFDQELADEKNALAAAEVDLRKTAEKTGVIQLSAQSEEIIRSIADVRAEIASREVQLQSLRTFATDQNPDTVRIQEEINTLRSQLAVLEKDPRNVQSTTTDFQAGRVPEVSLEYARKLREVRYHESLFDLLSKQYEAARIDEAKAAPIIQVIDRAVPPDKKSSPHRLFLTLGFAVFGLFLGFASTLVSATWRRMEQVPEYALKLARLRSGFPLGR